MGDLENKADELGGKAKEAFGEATGNESLENEGKADQAVSQGKEAVDDAVDAVKDKANEIIGKFKK